MRCFEILSQINVAEDVLCLPEVAGPSVLALLSQADPGNANAMLCYRYAPRSGQCHLPCVRTESGKVRCDVRPDEVACEARGPGSQGFLQAPIEMPESQCKYSPRPGRYALGSG
jgi:hypothetical protein